MQLSHQLLDLAALLLAYETGYSLSRRSDGPQGRSGQFVQKTILLFLGKPSNYYTLEQFNECVKI
jgi:hypothetical protein